jgi:hypothetical protein
MWLSESLMDFVFFVNGNPIRIFRHIRVCFVIFVLSAVAAKRVLRDCSSFFGSYFPLETPVD